MAYATYTTKALVCGTWDRNTADKSYLLFTEEAGMLYADARSARLEKSKQRYALQDFSLIRISLVKGKAGWRIGSVEPLVNHYQSATDKEARGSVVSLYRSLRRFYKGEDAAPDLFVYISDALPVLAGRVADRSSADTIVLLRLLYELGYVDKKRLPPEVFSPVTPDLMVEQSAKKLMKTLVEQGVTSSQL